MPSLRLSCGALVLLTAVCGCGGSDGPDRTEVAGAVLFQGKPLSAGTIRFVPTGPTKGPAAVGAITDGFYEIPEANGPVMGPHRVEIEAQLNLGFEIDDEQAYAKAFAETRGRPLPTQPVPPVYNRQSTLTADVLADGQTKFDFDLIVADHRR